jgi:hypothetical protein
VTKKMDHLRSAAAAVRVLSVAFYPCPIQQREPAKDGAPFIALDTTTRVVGVED